MDVYLRTFYGYEILQFKSTQLILLCIANRIQCACIVNLLTLILSIKCGIFK